MTGEACRAALQGDGDSAAILPEWQLGVAKVLASLAWCDWMVSVQSARRAICRKSMPMV